MAADQDVGRVVGVDRRQLAFIMVIKVWQNTDEYQSVFGQGEFGFVLNQIIAIVIITVNFLLKLVNRMLMGQERHASREDEQIAMFNKVAPMYIINTILMPIFVDSFPYFISQAWYEDGGVVQSALTLVLADAGGSLLRVIQFPPLIKRFVLAPLTSKSQAQTNKLWEPEPMFVGEPYANGLKTFAICLVYSPMWPLANILVMPGLLVCYVCFSFAICFWWRPPPQLSDELLHRMRADGSSS